MSSISIEGMSRFQNGRAEVCCDSVAVEEPLEIRVRGQAVTVTMRTPGHDPDLAAGFLLTEGIIRSRVDILDFQPCTQLADDGSESNVLNVVLSPEVTVDFARLTRHVFAASSCGICGKASIDAIRLHHAPIDANMQISAAVILSLPGRLRAAQTTFETTGGLHAAGLFDRDGNLSVAREDVGRHNAVDKVIGHSIMTATPGDILMVSGRTSFEILQKALAARIPVVAAVSAPSSLAVEFAREVGQTLIGFLRDQRMNLYSCPERVKK